MVSLDKIKKLNHDKIEAANPPSKKLVCCGLIYDCVNLV